MRLTRAPTSQTEAGGRGQAPPAGKRQGKLLSGGRVAEEEPAEEPDVRFRLLLAAAYTSLYALFVAMIPGLRILPSIRTTYASFNATNLLSKSFLSTMTTPTIALPTAEIHQLWFGGLDFRKGATPPTYEAVKRWFAPIPDFDKNCQS